MQVEAERKKRANILESEGKPPPLLLLISQPPPPFCLLFHHHTLFSLLAALTPPPLPSPSVSSLVLTSPLSGVRESAINRAQGLRQSKILASEAVQIEQVNKAKGKKNCAASCLSSAAKLASGTTCLVPGNETKTALTLFPGFHEQ